MNIKILFSLLSLLVGCNSWEPPTHHANIRCEAKYSQPDQTGYDVHPNQLTIKNIAVDTSGLDINLNKIDRLTDEVEECLFKLQKQFPQFSDEMAQSGQCESKTFNLPISRECLTVKVASDWFLSKYEFNGTHHQQLPYTNGGMCTNKGLPPGVCYYRVGIQDNLTIVVPPSFYLYKDGLVRIATGCHNPWYMDVLAACMEPSTPPLGSGNEP